MELKQQVLEKEITKINNNFQSIIHSSKISNDKTQSLREGLQLNVNTCSLLSAAENLLSLTSELKEIHLFYNFENTNKLNLERKQELNTKIKEGENLIKNINIKLNESLFELEDNLEKSNYS